MKLIKNIFLSFLACLTFISSTGFSMYKHYCGDNLKDISLFEETESCHDQEMENMPFEGCPFHQHTGDETPEEDDCCSDEYNRIELEVQQHLDHFKAKVSLKGVLVKILCFRTQEPIESEITGDLFDDSSNRFYGPPLYVQYVRFNLYG